MSGAVTKGRVDLDGTRQALELLGLLHAAERLPELLSEAVKQNLATHRFVDQLLAVELSQREERRIKTSLRLSGLPDLRTARGRQIASRDRAGRQSRRARFLRRFLSGSTNCGTQRSKTLTSRRRPCA